MSGRSGTRRRFRASLEHEIEEELQDHRHEDSVHDKSLLDAMLEVTEATRAEISEAVSRQVARKRA